MMVLLIVLLFFLLIACVPIGIAARYEQGPLLVWIAVGPLRFRVIPRNNNKGKQKKVDKVNSGKGFEEHAQTGRKRNDLTKYIPLLQLIFDFLEDFRSKLCVNDLRLKLILGGTDPYTLSVNYARAWAALGNLMPLAERYFVIKKRDVEIECDYCADNTWISGYINVTVTVAQIFALVTYHGIRALRKYFQITQNAKDGATS